MYGPPSLVATFLVMHALGRTTCLKTRSPSRISLSLTLELYRLAALCLAANSQMQATFLISSTKFATHFNSTLFTSWLNWERNHKGVSISTDSIAFAPYTMIKRISFVEEWGVVWYDHNFSWSSFVHKSLMLLSFFLSPFKIALFADSTCLVACWLTT